MGYLSNENYPSSRSSKVQADTFDILHASVITFESKRKGRSQFSYQPFWPSQLPRRIRTQKFINQIVEQYYAQGE
jgi:hypothetical protein